MTSVLRELPLSYAVRLHLKPGQKGTTQLLAQYGDRLICVRYRYDAQRTKRFKTVELLVADKLASNSACPGSSGENLHADARAPPK